MGFGDTACPNCGSRFLVRKIKTGGIFFGHTLDEYNLHRCYKCFTKFSPHDETPIEQARHGEILDVSLTLTTAGTKYSVDEFTITLKNSGDQPLNIDHVRLTFDEAESKTAPASTPVIAPGAVETIEIDWSWMYLEHRDISIEIHGEGETVAQTHHVVSHNN